jgi:hypothetical protein
MNDKVIYKMHNSTTRRYEQIDLDEAELSVGDIVMKFYRDNFTGRYVTVPGASLYQVNSEMELELVRS